MNQNQHAKLESKQTASNPGAPFPGERAGHAPHKARAGFRITNCSEPLHIEFHPTLAWLEATEDCLTVPEATDDFKIQLSEVQLISALLS